ncbi:isochorismatase family cysteine hydrolase [Bacillus testis]|uniref:isochorismatase family cysteine hydrolase n=1 Tax=Bacillus testis TaxID=1622072 RepID=UPI00067F2765|nr:isochorismatase family cysteine hydrolase [Bacillus testis]
MKKSETALLIIDMINHFQFANGDDCFHHTQSIVAPILQLKERARQNQVPVIYINDHYNLWQADYLKIINFCLTPQNESYISHIAPKEDDYFLIKPKHSAFYGTALNTLLHHLGAKKLIITGIAGNICVLFTANDAYMREYTLCCPDDCIASADQRDNAYALTMMANVLKADISSGNSLIF